MLESTILEFLLRGIPEGFLFIFAGYTFSKTKLQTKKFILSSIALGVIGYLVRFLPINFGIHSVLILIACIVMLNTIHKIPLVKAISSTLIIMIIGFAAEILNATIIALIRGVKFSEITQNPNLINIEFETTTQKVLYGIPSLILMGIILIVIYYNYKRKDKLLDASDREAIE